MLRQMIALVTGLSLVFVIVSPTLAADTISRDRWIGYEESSMPIDDMEGCLSYTGSITERRSYDYRITEFVSGPNQGNVHLVGVVEATFTISPDDGADGPVFEGSYREKVNLVGPSLDTPRVVSYSLPASATGSDGSRLKFLLHGHVVMTRDGEPKLEFEEVVCIQSPA